MDLLLQLMLNYATKGIEDWHNDAPNDVKQRAMVCLAGRITDNVYEAQGTIKAVFAGAADTRFRFIPMPRIPHNDRYYIRSFFVPMRREAQGVHTAAFDLFLLVDPKNALGFRFEMPDPPDHAHNYAHVQMNKQMMEGGMSVEGIPLWIPDSYPAFPIRATNPIQMFLAMVTTVHGHHEKGVESVVRRALESRPRDSLACMQELQAMFA